MNKYRDNHGYLHDRINPKHNDTTNFPLYDATYIIIGNPTLFEMWDYLTRIKKLFRDGSWHSSMITDDDEFSLDNSLGVVCALVSIIERMEKLLESEGDFPIENWDILYLAEDLLGKIEWFHKQNRHPEGLILTWYAKSKLFWPLLWIPFITMMYGALTPHELNKAAGDGSYQPKTSTHILTILWCVALDLKFTRWCYEKLLFRTMKEPAPETYLNWMKKNWEWYDWENIFMEYYKDENHPNVIASRNL